MSPQTPALALVVVAAAAFPETVPGRAALMPTPKGPRSGALAAPAILEARLPGRVVATLVPTPRRRVATGLTLLAALVVRA